MLTILFGWGGWGLVLYALVYLYDSGMKQQKPNEGYIIKLIGISLVLMVLMSACSTVGRVKYYDGSNWSGSGYGESFRQSSGAGGSPVGDYWTFYSRRFHQGNDGTG